MVQTCYEAVKSLKNHKKLLEDTRTNAWTVKIGERSGPLFNRSQNMNTDFNKSKMSHVALTRSNRIPVGDNLKITCIVFTRLMHVMHTYVIHK